MKVIWRHSTPGWVKVNTDDATFVSSSLAGCADVSRICRGFVKDYFAIPFEVCFAFEAERVVIVHDST